MSAGIAFDRRRAESYDQQARLSLLGYEVLHQLTADLLAVRLPPDAHVLLVGVGTGYEAGVLAGAMPQARFLGVDPSPEMLEVARQRLAEAGLTERIELVCGTIDDVPEEDRFAGAVMIGVLHHIDGNDARRALVGAVGQRLRLGSVLAFACQCGAWADHQGFSEAVRRRIDTSSLPAPLRSEMHDLAAKAQRDLRNPTEEEVASAIAAAGFDRAQRYFQSLLFTAWLAARV